jgi:transposase-like protein
VKSSSVFKWRHFEPTIILLCVRWYCRYQLSYRDLEEIMKERGLSLDHTTIFRWVQRYAPEINNRIRPHLKMSGTSYRIDETYVNAERNVGISIVQSIKKAIQSSSCYQRNAIFLQQNASFVR